MSNKERTDAEVIRLCERADKLVNFIQNAIHKKMDYFSMIEDPNGPGFTITFKNGDVFNVNIEIPEPEDLMDYGPIIQQSISQKENVVKENKEEDIWSEMKKEIMGNLQTTKTKYHEIFEKKLGFTDEKYLFFLVEEEGAQFLANLDDKDIFDCVARLLETFPEVSERVALMYSNLVTKNVLEKVTGLFQSKMHKSKY